MNRNDKILIVVLLVIALSFSFLYQYFVKEEGSRAVITVDGKEYMTLSLQENTEIMIEGTNGGTNHLLVKNGTVEMVEATCPDLVCVHQRAICYNGESIICLPNKVIIEIVGGEENEVDAVQ